MSRKYIQQGNIQPKYFNPNFSFVSSNQLLNQENLLLRSVEWLNWGIEQSSLYKPWFLRKAFVKFA